MSRNAAQGQLEHDANIVLCNTKDGSLYNTMFGYNPEPSHGGTKDTFVIEFAIEIGRRPCCALPANVFRDIVVFRFFRAPGRILGVLHEKIGLFGNQFPNDAFSTVTRREFPILVKSAHQHKISWPILRVNRYSERAICDHFVQGRALTDGPITILNPPRHRNIEVCYLGLSGVVQRARDHTLSNPPLKFCPLKRSERVHSIEISVRSHHQDYSDLQPER
jgi:hypothetical protein